MNARPPIKPDRCIALGPDACLLRHWAPFGWIVLPWRRGEHPLETTQRQAKEVTP